jgi:hypothetical protein
MSSTATADPVADVVVALLLISVQRGMALSSSPGIVRPPSSMRRLRSFLQRL